MLTLNISRQYAKIDITSVRATTNITTTPAQLTMETEPATIEIRQPKGELEIDWRPFRASLGIKGPAEFSRDCAVLGRQTALETIGRIAQDGDRLAAIESDENAVVALAIESATPPEPEITWAHLEPPRIHYTAHQPIISPSPGRVNYEFTRGTLDLGFQPGQVNIHMVQYPAIKLSVTESKSVDMRA